MSLNWITELVILSYFKGEQIKWRIATFSLEDTDSRSVLGCSRNATCTVFIGSTTLESSSKMNVFNLLNRICAHLWCLFQQHVSLWSTSKSLKHHIADLIEWFIFPLQESHEWLVLRYVLSYEGHLLESSTLEGFSLDDNIYGWTVSAGTRFPVVSNCIHLHVHADTGHSAWSLKNRSSDS